MRRVAGVQQRDGQGCSTGGAIPARHRNLLKAAQDVLTSSTLPAAPSASSHYQWMDVLPPCVNAGKDRSRAWP